MAFRFEQSRNHLNAVYNFNSECKEYSGHKKAIYKYIIREDRMISLFNAYMCWKTITIAFPFAISIDIYLIIK